MGPSVTTMIKFEDNRSHKNGAENYLPLVISSISLTVRTVGVDDILTTTTYLAWMAKGHGRSMTRSPAKGTPWYLVQTSKRCCRSRMVAVVGSNTSCTRRRGAAWPPKMATLEKLCRASSESALR